MNAMINTNPSLSCQQVQKTFISDFKREKTIALSNLTFSVQKGEVFGIIGPNGAGKSTTLKILMGFIRHDSGTVTLSGRHPSDPLAHRYVGYLPENPCLYEHLTAREHLSFAGRISGLPGSAIKNRIGHLLDMVDLSHAADKPVRGYSKGMTQRAALAYALFHEPEILILDEPMSGLDPLGRQLVVDIIQEYHKGGNTILFCSHILTDVERICDRIGIMDRGKLSAVITPDELKNRHDLQGRKAATPLEAFFMDTLETTGHTDSNLDSES